MAYAILEAYGRYSTLPVEREKIFHMCTKFYGELGSTGE